jgi:hypothetical protein
MDNFDGVIENTTQASEFSQASGKKKKKDTYKSIFNELKTELSKKYSPKEANERAKGLLAKVITKKSKADGDFVNFGGEPAVTKFVAVLADTPITDRLDVDNFYPASGNFFEKALSYTPLGMVKTGLENRAKRKDLEAKTNAATAKAMAKDTSTKDILGALKTPTASNKSSKGKMTTMTKVLIGGGILVVGIIGIIIYKKYKK